MEAAVAATKAGDVAAAVTPKLDDDDLTAFDVGRYCGVTGSRQRMTIHLVGTMGVSANAADAVARLCCLGRRLWLRTAVCDRGGLLA